MKVAIFDQVFKFMPILVEDWESKGHIVIKDKGWDPAKVTECDVSFFEFVDNSLMRASDPGDSFYQNPQYGPQPQGKKIIARAHDIDIHVGNLGRVQWEWVTDLVFVAQHLMDKALSEIDLPDTVRVHLIPHGIDTNKFTFKMKPMQKKIAWIGNINDHKRLETALMVLAELPRDYSLHVVGTGLGTWRKYYVENYIKDNGLNVEFIEHVESVNDFLEDKDFLLGTGMKEAFSFVSGEAMSKGIKTLIHNFWGAKEVWKDYPYIWNTVSEVVEMIKEQECHYQQEFYRNYIEQHYPLDRMLQRYDELVLS